MKRLALPLSVFFVLTNLSWSAEAPSAEDLLAELRGDKPAAERTPAELEAAYTTVLQSLVPLLSKANQELDETTARTLEALSLRTGRPGAEAERAAFCQSVLPFVSADTALGARLYLLRQLERVGGAECVETLTALLADKEPRVRERALRALQTNPAPGASESLRQALAKAQSPNEKIAFVNALAYRRDVQSTAVFAQLARNPEAPLALAAIDALGNLGTAAAAKALTDLDASTHGIRIAYALGKCAEALAAAGDKAQAEALFVRLIDQKQPPQVLNQGLRGLAALNSQQALPQTLAALQAADPQVQRLAAGVAGELRAADAATKLVALYPKLSRSAQLPLLASLGRLGDVAALPLALNTLKDGDEQLRAVALRTAAHVGGVKAVPALLQASLSAEASLKPLVHRLLVTLSGEGVEAEMLRLAREGEPRARAEMLIVLAERGSSAAKDMLLAAAQGPDADAAVSALDTLGVLVNVEDCSKLLNLALNAKDNDVRLAAEEALATAGGRKANAEGVVALIAAAFPTAATDRQVALLGVLGRLNGQAALDQLTAATESPTAEVKTAAVTALANSWEDSRPAPTLLRLAKEETDPTLKVVALRGFLRLLRPVASAKPNQTVPQLEQALKCATRPDEKKLALSVLSQCRVPEALTLAKEYEQDPELAAEAANAIKALSAPARPRRRGNRGGNVPAVPPTIDKLEAPWEGRDFEGIGVAGSAKLEKDTLTITASGADIQGTADGGHFVYQTLVGDGALVARVTSLTATNPWTKAGVMFRESVANDAPNVYVCVTPANGVSYQERVKANDQTTFKKITGPQAPYWVKLVREGDKFTGYQSADGKDWRKVSQGTVKLPNEVLAGLALTSHDNAKAATAVFDSIALTPAK